VYFRTEIIDFFFCVSGVMYYTSELIPAKFLILVAHFIICVLLLWNSPLSVKACLMEEVTEEVYRIHHTQ
jgi:hypothetical protein